MNVRGIDVSSYHGKIDFEKVKAEGIEFVIVRAGWGKAESDVRFKRNIEEALKAGLKVGVYWYLYAKNERDIIANAEKCDAVIAPYSRAITMKVWALWQYDSDKYKGRTSKAERTKWLKEFCELMTKKGYQTGVYSDTTYLKSKFENISEYPLWLSLCATSLGDYKPELWQHSTSGKIDGIIPRVNLNYYCDDSDKLVEPFPIPKTYPTLVKGAKNAYVKTLQSRLMELGYDIEKLGMVFDPSTLSAVLQFQKDRELNADGVVGPKTWTELYK